MKSKKQKYPRLLADERIYALGVAEAYASLVGRDKVDPGRDADGWWFLNLAGVVDHEWHAAVASGEQTADAKSMSMYYERRRYHFHRTLRWVAGGMPVYRIDYETTRALAHTSADSVRLGDVVWPAETFLVYFEPDRFHFLSKDGSPLRVAYVTRFDHSGTSGKQLLQNPGVVEEAARLGLDVTPQDEVELLSVHMFSAGEKRCLEAFYKLSSGLTVAEVLAARLSSSKLPVEAVASDTSRDLIQFVVSLALYLTAFKPKPAPITCPRVQKMLSGKPWTLPREWFVCPASVESRSDGQHGGSTASGHRSAHVVSGHWRMQAHGPGHSLRKPIWIKPHWRGDAQDFGVSKDYTVG